MQNGGAEEVPVVVVHAGGGGGGGGKKERKRIVEENKVKLRIVEENKIKLKYDQFLKEVEQISTAARIDLLKIIWHPVARVMLYVELLRHACDASPPNKNIVFEALWALEEASAYSVEVEEGGLERITILPIRIPPKPSTYADKENFKSKKVKTLFRRARGIVADERDPIRLQLMEMVSV